MIIYFPPLQNGCDICFEAPTKPVHVGGGDGHAAIFPNNKLWDKNTLSVCFLNPIPNSWKFEGRSITINGDIHTHVIDTTDILTLANKWKNDLPGTIPMDQRECVPTFVPVTEVSKADIRVWFSGESDMQFHTTTCLVITFCMHGCFNLSYTYILLKNCSMHACMAVIVCKHDIFVPPKQVCL